MYKQVGAVQTELYKQVSAVQTELYKLVIAVQTVVQTGGWGQTVV